MKNFMIIDTEKTYNVGVVIFNKEIIYKKQFVVKENFEDRKLCGEQNYKRKKTLFENNPDVEYGNAVEICDKLTHLVNNYQIETIFAHNCAEDRVSITNLYNQCKAYCSSQNIFDIANLVDTIKIVKTLYPENIYTSLEETINDILGISLHQVHTALDDCIWLSTILIPMSECLDLYTDAEYIMNNLKDNAIIDIINFFPEEREISDVELFTSIADADEDEYTIRTLNNRLKELVAHNILSVREEIKKGKNGQPLKTTDKFYKFTNPFGLNIIRKVKYFRTTDFQTEIEKMARKTLLPYINQNEKDNLSIFKEQIKKELEEQYLKQLNQLKEENDNFKSSIRNLEYMTQQLNQLEKDNDDLKSYIKNLEYKNIQQSNQLKETKFETSVSPKEDKVYYYRIKQEGLQELKKYANILTKILAIILTFFGLGFLGVPQFLCKRNDLGILSISIILIGILLNVSDDIGAVLIIITDIIIPIISIVNNNLDK